jgi:glycosyltransferase involved in cell wall biosynthesis
LVLAGADEKGYGNLVRQMVENLGLASNVTLTGFISGPDKLGALQDADVFVLPSRSEGLSIAMLEAMYMGLPVVVSDRVGLWREVANKNCGVVTAFEETALAEALRQVAKAPDRQEMGQRGRQLVTAQYTWDHIAHRLSDKIQEAIAL